MDEDEPKACWCVAQGLDTCACEVPFIGDRAEVARRVKEGSLEALWDETHTHYIVTREAIRSALTNDMAHGEPRLLLQEVK